MFHVLLPYEICDWNLVFGVCQINGSPDIQFIHLSTWSRGKAHDLLVNCCVFKFHEVHAGRVTQYSPPRFSGGHWVGLESSRVVGTWGLSSPLEEDLAIRLPWS